MAWHTGIMSRCAFSVLPGWDRRRVIGDKASAWTVVVAGDANDAPAVSGVAGRWHMMLQGSKVVY